jgi:hypothetical protein
MFVCSNVARGQVSGFPLNLLWKIEAKIYIGCWRWLCDTLVCLQNLQVCRKRYNVRTTVFEFSASASKNSQVNLASQGVNWGTNSLQLTVPYIKILVVPLENWLLPYLYVQVSKLRITIYPFWTIWSHAPHIQHKNTPLKKNPGRQNASCTSTQHAKIIKLQSIFVCIEFSIKNLETQRFYITKSVASRNKQVHIVVIFLEEESIACYAAIFIKLYDFLCIVLDRLGGWKESEKGGKKNRETSAQWKLNFSLSFAPCLDVFLCTQIPLWYRTLFFYFLHVHLYLNDNRDEDKKYFQSR